MFVYYFSSGKVRLFWKLGSPAVWIGPAGFTYFFCLSSDFNFFFSAGSLSIFYCIQTFDEIYSFDRPLGIIFPDGELWREQRKFGVKTLRQVTQKLKILTLFVEEIIMGS